MLLAISCTCNVVEVAALAPRDAAAHAPAATLTAPAAAINLVILIGPSSIRSDLRARRGHTDEPGTLWLLRKATVFARSLRQTRVHERRVERATGAPGTARPQR